jgi:hypothetical protein
MLDVSSTTKGFLAPRMTSAQRIAIPTPANGLLVFDTDTQSYWFRQNSFWTELPKSGSTNNYWQLNGVGGNEITNTNSGGFWSKNPIGLTGSATDITNPPTAPLSGVGTRMMWIPSRSAFRVGTITSYLPTFWDAVNIGLFSFASGLDTKASGLGSTALGISNISSGNYSFASGLDTKANGQASTAFGLQTIANGDYSTAMGVITTASGNTSTAMGVVTIASGSASTAMGAGTIASGDNSTAMGVNTTASGYISTALGNTTSAIVSNSTAMGYYTIANGFYSTALGNTTIASGINSTSMGYKTRAISKNSIAMGDSAKASGESSFAMGYHTIASGYHSTVMGSATTASGNGSTAMGFQTTSSGNTSTAMGIVTVASGDASTTMGYSTTASGYNSTATGYRTTASGDYSTSMGPNANTNNKVSAFAIGGINHNLTSRAINDKDYQMKMHFDEFKFLTGTANDVTITNGQITTSNTLSVFGVANNAISNYGYLGAISNAPTGYYSGSATIPYSIYSVSRVLGLEFDAFSDARHKKLRSYSNGKTDLSLLNQLKVSNYTFIDTVGKGTKMQMGFIAQQVEEIVPEAVNKIQDYIPSVYDMAKSMVYYADAHTLKVTTYKPHDFQAKDEIKLISLDKEHKVSVDKTIDAHTFIVRNWDKPIDKLFVFGKRVDDFRTVDYDRLFTLGISSIQELSRRVEQLEKENEMLKSESKAFKQIKSEIAELRAMIVK